MKTKSDRGGFNHPGEGVALGFLEGKGHRLLRRNYRCRFAEIDLVTLDGEGVCHFVEVKSWRAGGPIHPLGSLTAKKRSRMRNAALAFFRDRGEEGEASFDLVWVREDGATEHFERLF